MDFCKFHDIQKFASQETLKFSWSLVASRLVVTHSYINIQRTLTSITKPRGTSPYWKVNHINSSFFLNWCNVNPDKISKWDLLWFRGFVSIILNPFSRVFAISAFLKIINAPINPKRGYPENNLRTHIFSNPCNQNFSWTL